MTRSKGIPHAREQITSVILKIETKAAKSPFRDQIVAELLEIRDVHLWRNVEKKPSRRVSRRMTPDLVRDIIVAISARPTASNRELAEVFGVQAGRITEVRQGRYAKLLSAELRVALGKMKALDAPEQLSFLRRAA
jgi:hypothetical protein